jgi:hypothetical protein
VARSSKARRRVVVLTPIFCFYIFLVLSRAVTLLKDDRWSLRWTGVALVILAVVTTLLVFWEIRFGRQSEQLSRAYDAAVVVDEPALPLTASGRPELEAADAAFDRAKQGVEERPQDWKAWYRLALAYGDARDVKRGRKAMRRAIAIYHAGT